MGERADEPAQASRAEIGPEIGPAEIGPAGTASRAGGVTKERHSDAVAPGRRVAVMRAFRLGALALALLLTVVIGVLVVSGWGAKPSKDDLAKGAGLPGKRELLIGVKEDQPGISLRDKATGRFSGFDIDIAYLIASDLGFRPNEVRFLAIESEDRARMQARTTEDRYVTVDLVIASYSITPDRENQPGVSFAGPYLVTEQSVVTRKDHPPVQTLADLRGARVCSLTTATSESAPARAGANLLSRNRISDCITGLKNNQFEAVTTDAAILAGFVARDPELLHHDIGLDGTESWGINTGGNEDLRTLVNHALYRSATDPHDRRWEDAFDRNLAGLQPANQQQQVAIGEQPDIEKVEIREWPWEQSDARRVALPPVLPPAPRPFR